MRFPASARSTRPLGLGLLAALAVTAATASSASAAFSIAECGGSATAARGASFQTNAITGFKNVFKTAAPAGCGASAPDVAYDPAGSGAGRAALGERGATNPTGTRDPSVRFAGSDEPPTAAQRAQIESGPIDANGQDVTAADNNKVHLIPVAIGSNTLMVKLPAACAGSVPADPTPLRQVPNATIEGAFAGDVTTVGGLIPALAGVGGCGDAVLRRVVRLDSSGTTFALKQYLAKLNGGRGWAALGNTAWPANSGATAVVRGTANGGGPLRDALNALPATEGGIGYADLATARGGTGAPFLFSGAGDVSYYLQVAGGTTGTGAYGEPSVNPAGYQAGQASGGANCATADPPTPADTFGDWSAVDASLTATAYALCTLTYDLAFDDNATAFCNSAEEQARARTVRDFLVKGALSDAGQASLAGQNYGPLPADILAKGRAGANAIGWQKANAGRACPAAGGGAGTGGGSGGGGAVNPVSNRISISSRRVKGTSIILRIRVPNAGKLTVTSSGKPKRRKTIKLSTVRKTATKAGTQTLTIKLSKKARSALRRDKRFKVSMRIRFAPNGGQARTTSASVTVKVKKASKKK